MTRKKLILIGGGGHCKSCIDVIEQENKFEIEGILDKDEFVGSTVLGHKVIGSDDQIEGMVKEKYYFLITVGQLKSADLRAQLFFKLNDLKASIATIISPYACVSKNAEIGKGSIVMHNSLINADVKVGENTILNTGSILEHGVKIGAHCHISTGAIINGDCRIGNEVFIGSNSTISNGVNICNKVVVGAGSVIIRNIVRPSSVYVGNPGREIYR
jgi:sugar O-acyltransferase (sialic acid O-acetyltransferase NeuD family)